MREFMTEEIIKALPDILKKHISTLKKTSLDETNREYMCESNRKVINFDKLPNEFARGKKWKNVPNSNDALTVDQAGNWYFIEFKNGEVKKEHIYRKLYDSLIMMLELGIFPDFDFIRNYVYYILVLKFYIQINHFYKEDNFL